MITLYTHMPLYLYTNYITEEPSTHVYVTHTSQQVGQCYQFFPFNYKELLLVVFCSDHDCRKLGVHFLNVSLQTSKMAIDFF